MNIFHRLLLTIFTFSLFSPVFSADFLQLVSTESDPDAFIQNCVNVINGDYCESATDLMVPGPDALVLQRFHSNTDVITGNQPGGWRILPQRFLVIGKDFSKKSSVVGKDKFDWTLALVGERSGGILPYSGWRNVNRTTKDPLKVDALNTSLGMVNTYAGEINGQTNHKNNLLNCKGDTTELILGDGTKRIYQKVQQLPSLLLGEELTPLMAGQMIEPDFYLLTEEIFPSGNRLFFSYDEAGHLTSLEMKNKTSTKTFSRIDFIYEFQESDCRIHIATSDARKLTYHFALDNGIYRLKNVEGSHCVPVSYEYNDDSLIKKTLPEGRFIEIEYREGKVISLNGPNSMTGQNEQVHSFSYGKDYTDVFNAMGVKTRYVFDKRLQLTAIERYDDKNNLYHIERKYWGKSKTDTGFLLAKTIGDGSGRVHSYRSFQYDKSCNVIEQRLYGNLTGKQDASLQISPDGKLLNPDEEECNVKTFGYSSDGFNLLTKMGDCKGNQTLYTYKLGTNLPIKKFIYEKGSIKKRTFKFYNDEGICIKIIKDDSASEENSKYSWMNCNERYIKEIKPKETLPGVGLPEVIEEKTVDSTKTQEVLLKKMVNVFDDQSNLLSCDTYDADGEYVFTESKRYNAYGQVVFHKNAAGREAVFSYDGIGNLTSFSQDDKTILTDFDFQDRPIVITEITGESQFSLCNNYDAFGRKISSTDRFGNITQYEYDVFHRLTKVIHPEVLNETNQAIRPTFSYTYDIFGNVLTIEDPKGGITSKSYNLRGSPTRINYPDGTYELFKYDCEGSLHRSLTREQIITVYEYDYLGRCIYEENSIANDAGVASYLSKRNRTYNGFRCTYEKDPTGCIKHYYYDSAGRLTSFVQHDISIYENHLDSRCAEFIYDSLGRVKHKKVPFANEAQDYCLECYEYDLSGNIIEKRIEDPQGAVLLRKYFAYDLQGHCIEEYGIEDGIKTGLIKTIYNSEGEPVEYLDGSNRETKVIIHQDFQNSSGQIVPKKTIVNPLGVQTEIEFDALGRIYSIVKKDPMGILLSSQKILYDALGNKACEVNDRIVDGKILDSQKTRWIYGPMDRLEEEVEAAGTSLEKRISYTYNELGRLTEKSISGTYVPINYLYNRVGRLEKIQARNAKNEVLISNSYFYNDKGDIVSASTFDGKSIQRAYNAYNQVTKETVGDGEGYYTSEYAYDRKGRLREVVLPDKSKIAYAYDAVFGREVNRISATGEVVYTHTYDSYDSLGKLLSETSIGYLGSKEYVYDLSGQKISSKNMFIDEQYTRDSLGRLLEVTGNKHEEYSYNALSQLISENKASTKTYAYDSLDNRIKADNEELHYNSLNQLTSYSKAEFSYDNQGNLLRKVLDGEETRFESNILSQLVSIEKADKTKLTFSYDPFNRLLVEKHLDGQDKNKKALSCSRYFYLGYQEIGTLDKAGNFETLKIPGLQGDELSCSSIAFEIKSETFVPIHDIAGNVVSLIDPIFCQPVESYEYTAFGEETIYNADGEKQEFSQVSNPWRFAEKRFDPQSGLILFGLRFYDPTTGRWISQDPAGFIDGPNLYAYLHNNPVNHLDRFGLTTEANSQNKFDEYFYGEVENHCYCEKHRTCKRGGDIGSTDGSGLPKITYCDNFEHFHNHYKSEEEFWANQEHYDDFRPYYERSRIYDLNLPELFDMEIGFINGIDNTFEEAKATASYISVLAGGCNVHAVYNATHGKTIDLRECQLGLDHVATEPVRQLHKMWDSFFDRSSSCAKYLMICHSQGAIHVMNALLDYHPELRDRILVVAIAPGGYIFEESCGKVVHYRAEAHRDPIPRLDKQGSRRSKETIIELESHADASFFDHTFTSPTYLRELYTRIATYKSSKGSNI